MYIFSIYLCFHRAHGAAYVIKKARSQLSSEEGAPGSATSAATSGSGVSSESGSRGSSRGPFSHHRRRSRWEFHHIYLQIYAHAYARALSQLRPRLLQPEVVLLVRVVMWSSPGGSLIPSQTTFRVKRSLLLNAHARALCTATATGGSGVSSGDHPGGILAITFQGFRHHTHTRT